MTIDTEIDEISIEDRDESRFRAPLNGKQPLSTDLKLQDLE